MEIPSLSSNSDRGSWGLCNPRWEPPETSIAFKRQPGMRGQQLVRWLPLFHCAARERTSQSLTALQAVHTSDHSAWSLHQTTKFPDRHLAISSRSYHFCRFGVLLYQTTKIQPRHVLQDKQQTQGRVRQPQFSRTEKPS